MTPRICAQCRTLLGDDLQCDVCGDHAFSLTTDRALLDEHVWRRPRVREHNPAWFGPAITGTTVAMISYLSQGPVGALVIGGLASAAYATLHVFAKPSAGSGARAQGAAHRPRPPTSIAQGVIRDVSLEDDEPDWLEGAATWIVFQVGKGNGVSLRMGRTRALVLHLDDGRRVQVPRGRCRVEARRGTRETIYQVEARRIANEIEPREFEDETVVPVDQAYRVVLQVGDRVELIGPIASQEALDRSYRTSATNGLRFAGVPWMRLLDRDESSSPVI